MKLDRQKLFRLSRDPRFLIRTAATIGIISILAGLIVSFTSTRAGVLPFLIEFEDDVPEGVFDRLGNFLDLGELDAAEAADLIRNPEKIWGEFYRMLEEITRGNDEVDFSGLKAAFIPLLEGEISSEESIDPSDRKLLLDLSHGLHGEETQAEAALESLRSAAAMEPPRRFASEFLADVLARRGEIDPAIESHRLEISRFGDEAIYSRARILALLQQEGRTAELRELFSLPEYQRALSVLDRIEIATALRNYPALIRAIIAYDLEIGRFGLFFLSLVAGGIWAIIVTQFSGYGRKRILFYIAAVILGWFSATGTLFVVQIQEEIQGFQLDYQGNLASQLIYCIAGIGLREESLKLLFFVPLALILLKSRRNEVDALICAGLVGLGFAINENSGYVYGHASAFSAWSRFLTANFLHIAMTGVIGLAFFRMCRWPRRQWDQFLYDFLIIVAIHGAYDALLMLPALQDYQALWLVVYALTSYLFLDKAKDLMGTGASHAVSPLGVFVTGSALLMGVIFLYACWGMHFFGALTAYIGTLADLFPIAFVFINRFRDR